VVGPVALLGLPEAASTEKGEARRRGLIELTQRIGTILGRGEAGLIFLEFPHGELRQRRVPAWAYLKMPPMIEAKKITKPTKSNPVTIFLFRVTPRGRRR
jgi:hypothetical protein